VDQLPGLLPGAHAVVVMTSLNPQTRGMVDSGFLAQLPDGAVLVNAARGQVVVTDDLLAELQSGRLRAALDVTDPEPLPPGHPLWRAPGLFLTPHVGAATAGMARRALTTAVAQLEQFARGERPTNLIDRADLA
jgi:phosphoglycerate dehydrogenase-like enzyme